MAPPVGPVVTGSPVVGQTLTSTQSGQWYRDGLLIPGAVGTTYSPTELDIDFALTCVVGGLSSTPTALVSGVLSFSDNFNRADGLLSASAGWSVSSLSTNPNNMTIASNQLRLADTSTEGSSAAVTALDSLDHFAQCTLVSGTNGRIIAVRFEDQNNWIGVGYVSGTGIIRYSRALGPAASVSQTTISNPTVNTGDILRIEAIGDTQNILLNGTVIYTGTGVNTISPNAAKAAVIARSTGVNIIDDFQAGTIGTIRRPAKQASIVAAHGDSLTRGTGASDGDASGIARFTNTGEKSYPGQLATRLGKPIWVRATPGTTSTNIFTNYRADVLYYDAVHLIWAGRNNFAAPTTVMSNIASMVDIANRNAEGRFVVLSILNSSINASDGSGTQEQSGTTPYTQIMDINSQLAAAYPNNYLDIRGLLVAQGAPTGAYPDAAMYAGDQIPLALRVADKLHLNDTGYGVVAKAVGDVLLAKGWVKPT